MIETIKILVKKLSIIMAMCLICVSCSDRYNEGYDDGYKKGHKTGYSKGHRKGHEKGHEDGYMDGTVAFVKDGFTPSLGLIILILMSITGLYFIYMYYKDPTKRVIDKSADKAEELRQQIILKSELNRRIKSEEEIARAKASRLATEVFESSKKALGEAYSVKEMEKMKEEIEERIFNAQASEIDDIINQYKKTYENLKNTKHVNAKEKAKLFSSLKDML